MQIVGIKKDGESVIVIDALKREHRCGSGSDLWSTIQSILSDSSLPAVQVEKSQKVRSGPRRVGGRRRTTKEQEADIRRVGNLITQMVPGSDAALNIAGDILGGLTRVTKRS